CSSDLVGGQLCEAPLFMIFNYKDLIVKPGKQAQLDCGVHGNYSHCLWEKDNYIFQVENVYKGMYKGLRRPDSIEDNQCGIVVEHTTNKTHGVWTCTVYNSEYGAFVASKNCVITVKPTPTKVSTKQITAYPGDLHEIKCSVMAARPAVKITWTLNARDITADAEAKEIYNNQE
ncbi:unnamed protein product, partial [Meganyctiphanes norvegica]